MKKGTIIKKIMLVLGFLIFGSFVFGTINANAEVPFRLNTAAEIKVRTDALVPGELLIIQPGDTIYEIGKAINEPDLQKLANLNGYQLDGDEYYLRVGTPFALNAGEAKLLALGLPKEERIAFAKKAANSLIEYDSIEEAKKAVKNSTSPKSAIKKASKIAASTAFNDNNLVFKRNQRSHSDIRKDTTDILNKLDGELEKQNVPVEERVETIAETSGRVAARAASEGPVDAGVGGEVAKGIANGEKPAVAAEHAETQGQQIIDPPKTDPPVTQTTVEAVTSDLTAGPAPQITVDVPETALNMALTLDLGTGQAPPVNPTIITFIKDGSSLWNGWSNNISFTATAVFSNERVEITRDKIPLEFVTDDKGVRTYQYSISDDWWKVKLKTRAVLQLSYISVVFFDNDDPENAKKRIPANSSTEFVLSKGRRMIYDGKQKDKFSADSELSRIKYVDS